MPYWSGFNPWRGISWSGVLTHKGAMWLETGEAHLGKSYTRRNPTLNTYAAALPSPPSVLLLATLSTAPSAALRSTCQYPVQMSVVVPPLPPPSLVYTVWLVVSLWAPGNMVVCLVARPAYSCHLACGLMGVGLGGSTCMALPSSGTDQAPA